MPMSSRRCDAVWVNAAGKRKPLLSGRGGVLIVDFCLSTGLDRDTVEELVRAGRLEGGLSTHKEPIRSGVIFDDALPSRDELVAMGVPVRDDYDPQALRYGGIECQTHGWAQSILLTRHDAESQQEVPDRDMCWECSRAGVPPDDGNSRRYESEVVQRWIRTHDSDGNWIGSEEDEKPHD